MQALSFRNLILGILEAMESQLLQEKQTADMMIERKSATKKQIYVISNPANHADFAVMHFQTQTWFFKQAPLAAFFINQDSFGH